MKLFVTGGAGFIGSWFIRQWLAAHPHDVIVNLDRLTYAGSPARLEDVASSASYRFVQGDIIDPNVVRRAIDGAHAVVHCAAETHVDRSITNAAPFLRTNIEGTHVVLDAARSAGVGRVVHISTDEVYGPVLTGAVDERAPLAPHSPYAASKAGGDLLGQAMHLTYGLPVVIARPTNVYGPWQLPEKFMPVCITAGLEGRSIPLYGDGQQRRNWLFVEDLCQALALLLERGAAGQIYNIGSGHEQSNLETAQQIVQHLGQSSALIQRVADRPGHDRRYAMQDAKIRALGWKPSTTFVQGVRATVDWYRAHEAWWRPLTQQLREDPYHWLNRPAGSGAHPQAARRR